MDGVDTLKVHFRLRVEGEVVTRKTCQLPCGVLAPTDGVSSVHILDLRGKGIPGRVRLKSQKFV